MSSQLVWTNLPLWLRKQRYLRFIRILLKHSSCAGRWSASLSVTMFTTHSCCWWSYIPCGILVEKHWNIEGSHLLPYDKIDETKTICQYCAKRRLWSANTDTVYDGWTIGGNETYIPVCRKIFANDNSKAIKLWQLNRDATMEKLFDVEFGWRTSKQLLQPTQLVYGWSIH